MAIGSIARVEVEAEGEATVARHDVSERPTVLVIGATGMLGHALCLEWADDDRLTVVGTVRGPEAPGILGERCPDRILTAVDVLDRAALARVMAEVQPDVVVNAVGVIKQVPTVKDIALTAELNGLLPHLLANHCSEQGARLIQVSTDCVFSGRRGGYTEADLPDPVDFYGRSKLMGEVDTPHVTLRTSIIGPELRQKASLFEWFLSQAGRTVRGFTQAVYSGVTTVELARVIREVVIPRPELTGVWHVAASPITKADLLRVIADEYDWEGEIVPDDEVRIDRSMSALRLHEETGYSPPPWPQMIAEQRRAQASWAASAAGERVPR